MISLPHRATSSSPSPSPKASGRKGSKKVRTGCITCKIRKVKCDEAKPHCLRCVRTGRKCDGYRESTRSTPEPLALSPVPGLGFGSDREAHAFDYYRARSAKILSGAIDAGFWGGLVLKLSATEPAVRHAILAVSSLHECVEVKNTTGRELDRSFAFREYGNAIRSLRNWAQRDEHSAIPLLVCILFVCIEFLADRDSASQMHIIQGRKILSGLADGHSPAMELIKQSLVPIYARLSLASFLFGARPASIPAHLKSWTEVPAVFTSIEEARCGLYLLLDEGLQFSTAANSVAFDPATDAEAMYNLQLEQQRLLSQLTRWHAAFTVFTSMTPQSPASENVQNLLRVYYNSSFVWISTSLRRDELAFDAHLPAFSAIISLASSIINSLPPNAKMEAFSFETELVAPVYWTVTKCRHPLLRRAALKLLTRDQMRNRRENLWHVREAVVVSARVIEKEEAGFGDGFSMSTSPDISESSSDGSSYSSSTRSGSMERQTSPSLKVAVTKPPSLTPPPPSFTDPMSGEESGDGFSPEPSASPRFSDEPTSPTNIAAEAMQQLELSTVRPDTLESPFGVPESRRIKNAVIGPAVDHGVWVTFFKDPEPGEAEWNVTREFLRC
ncbi:hypothetical protein BGZ61DRAFT_504582 [Ilyonectria robusta]|uniref:uncharacterized protein n=1 Tax=Ilyonectria robusta TaxID=1079257 RepID=UPI001E8ED9A4|nr:uncharacterized protein BGZ61DRAFT_504582 [Ilyonectria robusta]KAH8729832.1 hypothetical protein BGZ61DRAFT_504582 [Ilyonectria robusta]